jgi:hypothetical protein
MFTGGASGCCLFFFLELTFPGIYCGSVDGIAIPYLQTAKDGEDGERRFVQI